MPLPFIWSGAAAIAAGELTFLTYGLTKAGGETRAATITGMPRVLTAAEERAADVEERRRRVELLEKQDRFREELDTSKFLEQSAASRQRQTLEEARLREDVAARERQSDRLEKEFNERLEAQRLESIERAKERQAELELRRLDIQERTALNRAMVEQEARSREFQAFASTVPPGSTAAIGPLGDFRVVPAGSQLTAQDVAAGFEPLAFSLSPTTAQRITTLPGVFVGPGFQYQTVEEAQRALRGLPPAPVGGGERGRL